VIPLPDLIEKNRELGEVLVLVHKGFGIALMILVIGHIAMALKHQFRDRDGTLSRMLFGPNRRGTRSAITQTTVTTSTTSSRSE
jgi:cytochrome b561